MIEEKHTIGLVLERITLSGPWGGFQWRPSSVFATPPETDAWTSLGTSGSSARFYAGAYDVHLYSTETANYRDNLQSGEPKLWIVMRPDGPEPPVEIVTVTADPAEGEANTEAGGNVVETIVMPHELAHAIAKFFAEHHVERPVIKRRRDNQDPAVNWRNGRQAEAARPSHQQPGIKR